MLHSMIYLKISSIFTKKKSKKNQKKTKTKTDLSKINQILYYTFFRFDIFDALKDYQIFFNLITSIL